MARDRDGQLTAAVRVLFFARYAELVGRAEASLTIPLPATLADVVDHVRRELPGGAQLPEQPLMALNATHTRLDAVVTEGDEIAFLPALAGG